MFAALVKGGGDMYLMNQGGRIPMDVGFDGNEDEKTKRETFRVWWEEVKDATAVIDDAAFSPLHPVNPRDLLGKADSLVSFYPAFLPPHLLYTRTTLRKEWKIRLSAGRCIHVPARVVRRWQAGSLGSG